MPSEASRYFPEREYSGNRGVVQVSTPDSSAEEMEERITKPIRAQPPSTSGQRHGAHRVANGEQPRSIVKIFFHPNVKIEMAVAQVTAQGICRRSPDASRYLAAVFTLVYNASSVPVMQLSLYPGKGLSEQQLFDYATNQHPHQSLATVKGAAIPWPYGGKQRQVMIDIVPQLLQAKGLSPADSG